MRFSIPNVSQVLALGTLLLSLAHAAPSTDKKPDVVSHGSIAGEVIPGRYIVVFKESVTAEQSKPSFFFALAIHAMLFVFENEYL